MHRSVCPGIDHKVCLSGRTWLWEYPAPCPTKPDLLSLGLEEAQFHITWDQRILLTHKSDQASPLLSVPWWFPQSLRIPSKVLSIAQPLATSLPSVPTWPPCLFLNTPTGFPLKAFAFIFPLPLSSTPSDKCRAYRSFHSGPSPPGKWLL